MVERPQTDAPRPPRIAQPFRSPAHAPSQPHSNLRASLAVLWRWKWQILAITVLVLGLALLVSSRQTAIYESQAAILVVPADLGGSEDPEILNMATEAQLMSSVQVADIVARDIGFAGDPRRLLDELTVNQPPETEILEISYRDPDPARARRLTAAFGEAYLQQRADAADERISDAEEEIQRELAALEVRLNDVERELAGLPRNSLGRGRLEAEAATLGNLILDRQLAQFALPDQVAVGRVIQPALTPTSPVGPSIWIAAALGLVAGLALGIGWAFTRDRLSERLRSAEETEEHLRAPILGTIPQIPQWRRRSKPMLISTTDQRSSAAEAYRILRTNLLASVRVSGAKSIVVTSAYSGEGKSATVANLGVLLARAGKHVSLVSADLRRPRLHEFFGRDGGVGLSDVLAGTVSLAKSLQAVIPPSPGSEVSSVGLQILPSGRVPHDPSELLTTERMAEVLRELEEASDIVLIDAPPVLAVSDALVVAQVSQGVLIVLGPNSIERSTVLAVRQQLDKVGAHVLGGVLNGPDSLTAQTDYSYY